MKKLERLRGDGTPGPWRILELVSGATAVPRALQVPMLGRDDELTRIRSAFRRAVRSKAVQRLTVLGEAGIGKSRLAREAAASIGGEAHVITLRCPSDGEGAFLPVRQAVIEAAGLLGWRALHGLLATIAHGPVSLGGIAEAMGLRAEAKTAPALLTALRQLFMTLAAK